MVGSRRRRVWCFDRYSEQTRSWVQDRKPQVALRPAALRRVAPRLVALRLAVPRRVALRLVALRRVALRLVGLRRAVLRRVAPRLVALRPATAANLLLVAWSILLCLLIMAPLAAPGFVLSYDMVAVPDQVLVPSAYGVSSAMPRAVPLDAVVAVVDSVLPGAAVQRLALAGIMVGSAVGAGLALPQVPVRLRIVAASVYTWNAYVFERLVVGHWPLLVAYAVLPWLVPLARSVRENRRGGLAGGVFLVGLASLTPTGGLLASVLFAALVLAPGGRHGRPARVVVVVAVVLLQGPWLVPSLLLPGPALSDPAGVAAFASRSDTPSGLLGSVLSLGGIWNAGAVPDSRALVSSAILTGTLLALAVAGLRELARYLGRTELAVLAGLAAAGLVLALAGAMPGGQWLVQWLVTNVPGSGLIRDGQKFLAWYALPVALAAAAGVARLTRLLQTRSTCRQRGQWGVVVASGSGVHRTPRPAVAWWLAAVAALLPLAALPDLGWGAGGRLEPVRYPVQWADVRTTLQRSETDGDLIVLPYQPFRRFPWAGGRTVLDPAPRYLGVETVVPDALPVGGMVVAGEDIRAARVVSALGSDRPLAGLAAAGIGWIAVERDTPGVIPADVLTEAEPININGVLDLYRVPEPVAQWTSVPPSAPVKAADIVSLVIFAAASADLVRNACSRRCRSLASRMS